MKTIPFNKDHARAGRPVVYNGVGVKLIHTFGGMAWVRHFEGTHEVHDCRYLDHPADPAPGHNPAGLDEWTVETRDGWRLLVREEILHTRELSKDIQGWADGAWLPEQGGQSVRRTYRTKRPAGYFLPRPKTRMIRQGELPDVFLWKEKENIRPSITHRASWTLEEIESAARDGWQWSRSLDGPWRPFTVEEK